MLQRVVAHKDRTTVITPLAHKREQPGFTPFDLFAVVASGVRVRETAVAQQMAAMVNDRLERVPSGLPKIGMIVEHQCGRRQTELMQSHADIDKVELRRLFHSIDYEALARQILEGFLLVIGHGDMAHCSFEPFLEGKSGYYIDRITERVPVDHL